MNNSLAHLVGKTSDNWWDYLKTRKKACKSSEEWPERFLPMSWDLQKLVSPA